MIRTKPVDCVSENSRMVPLIKVVKAAIVDTYGDINSLQQLYLHWAGRGFLKLQREILKLGVKKVSLTVNANTKTATLPLDFETETFVGIIDRNGHKIPLNKSPKLADNCNYDEVAAEDKCTSCGQDKSICEELSVTEETTLVVINSSTYEDKIIKKLYPNGDYWLETTKHVLSLVDDTVTPLVTKEFITNLGLKPCGCLETTTENIANIRTHCYDTYCCHYSSCNDSCAPLQYGYRIFPETGLIQLDFNFPYSKIYLEHTGYIPKKNGQYVVPEVAFETLVEYIKWKEIKDKRGVEKWRIESAERSYYRERGNMTKIRGRVSLAAIMHSMRKGPKFNVDFDNDWYSCFRRVEATTTVSDSTGSITTSVASTTIINNGSYQLAVMTGNGPGHPVEGQSTYQNNLLKGSSDTEVVWLANQTLTKIRQDFTIDTVTGTIDISPNTFFNGDALVIPYNKIS